MKILVCSHIKKTILQDFEYDFHVADDCKPSDLVWLSQQAINGDEIWYIKGHWNHGELTLADLNGDFCVENILIKVFDVLTPQNHALSRILANLVHDYSDNKRTKESIFDEVNHYIEISVDDRQKDALNMIITSIDVLAGKKDVKND